MTSTSTETECPHVQHREAVHARMRAGITRVCRESWMCVSGKLVWGGGWAES